MRPRQDPFPAVFAVVAALAATALASPTPTAAQERAQEIIEQRTGQQVSQEQILQRLQASGLTQEQVRSRLQQAGYDPSLADPYFQRLQQQGGGQQGQAGGGGQLPQANADFVSALQSIGIAVQGAQVGPSATDTITAGEALREAQEREAGEAGAQGGAGPAHAEPLPIFGMNVFSRQTSQFQAITTGPVDPGYRLGPGDQIILVITGDVELAYTLDVSREGFVVIPDVGQVSVNGLTLEQLRERLYDRLGQVYSGVDRDPEEATTHFNVSIGQLRRNLVYFIGEVGSPGAYQISSVATVFNGLHRAGGPTARGSFRKITVRRGGEVERRIDLYDYLLDGDTRDDVRMEQGDIVHVPLSGPRVAVRGQVRRPGRYELRGDEDFRDAIDFAGGLAPDAFVQRLQVDRILPPDERRPGHERVLIDVDLSRLDEGAEPFALKDGDEIRVFGISDERRNRVTLRGPVFRPGVYEYRTGMTIWDLIYRADGLLPEAFPVVAHVFRVDPEDRTLDLHRVSLERDSAGAPVDDLELVDLDEVVVYGRGNLLNPEEVQVLGQVKSPGSYPLAENMTVQDLILAAGGYEKGALGLEAEVVRIETGVERTDTIARSFRVALGDALPSDMAYTRDDGDNGGGTAGRSSSLPAASDFRLEDQDRVFIRRRPGYSPPATVEVSGNVLYPGSYGLRDREERLASVIERAGGLTNEAYPQGFRLVRERVPVGVDLQNALQNPSSEENVALEPGDQLVVPSYRPTVLVRGAVQFESRVLYQEGMELSDFLAQAGGTTEGADEERITVEYANGERDVRKERFMFFDYNPDVRPGSTVIVPVKPQDDDGVDWGSVVSRSVSVLGTAATLMIAISRF